MVWFMLWFYGMVQYGSMVWFMLWFYGMVLWYGSVPELLAAMRPECAECDYVPGLTVLHPSLSGMEDQRGRLLRNRRYCLV